MPFGSTSRSECREAGTRELLPPSPILREMRGSKQKIKMAACSGLALGQADGLPHCDFIFCSRAFILLLVISMEFGTVYVIYLSFLFHHNNFVR